jgi:hypothetical protein
MGRQGAAFAHALSRCGLDVSIFEPRTFGSSVAAQSGWQRMWLSVASVGLGKTLSEAVIRDVATADAALRRKLRAPTTLVWAAGPEVGATTLLLASGGGLGLADLFLSDAPTALVRGAREGAYPPWTALIPGLLLKTDFNHMAFGLQASGRLKVIRAPEGLIAGAAETVDPITSRVEAAQAILNRFGLGDCLKEVPLGASLRPISDDES